MANSMVPVSLDFYKKFMANIIALYGNLKTKYNTFKGQIQECGGSFYDFVTQQKDPAIQLSMLNNAYNLDNNEYDSFETWIKSNSALISFFKSVQTAINKGSNGEVTNLSRYLLEHQQVTSPYVSEIYNVLTGSQLYFYSVGFEEETTMATLNVTDGVQENLIRDTMGIYNGNYSANKRYTLTKQNGIITSISTAPAYVKIVGNASNTIELNGYGFNQANKNIQQITETIEVVNGQVITTKKFLYLTQAIVKADTIHNGTYTFYNVPYAFVYDYQKFQGISQTISSSESEESDSSLEE